MPELQVSDVFTADWPPFHFAVPEGFHDLPLVPDPAERLLTLDRMFGKALDQIDQQQAAAMLFLWTAMTDEMLREGVIYGGVTLFQNDEGELSSANLLVTVVESDHDVPDTAAFALHEMLSKGYPEADVKTVALPCGPATVMIEFSKISVAGETPEDEGADIYIGEIRAYVPFPTAPWVAIFQLSTPCLRDWAGYAELMAIILQTVQFPQPGLENQPRQSVAEALDGERPSQKEDG